MQVLIMLCGYYICFIDADDYIEETMIEKLVTSIQIDKSDISICNYIPNKETNLKNTFTVNEAMDLIINKNYFRGYVFNKLYIKDKIENIRFDEKLYIAEDFWFNCQYLLKCTKCSYTDERLYHYSHNAQSALNKELNKNYLTILDSYDKLLNVYKQNYAESLNYLYIDIFKICCDIIYKNSLIGNKIDIAKVYKKKKELFYLIIKSKSVNILKKVEICIYNLMPIFIGKLKKIKYRKE